MMKLLMVALLGLSASQIVSAESKLIYKDKTQGTFYYDNKGSLANVNVYNGPIPYTTLLVQKIINLDKSDEPRECVTLVKGDIRTKEDIWALKPESILQMSCSLLSVGTYNWFDLYPNVPKP
ncbi:MAG: hypothetical protein KDI39_14745 [Pseudomonadales bacterium]|nr:hypothetical protein [Pseudomonadales bacterium]